MTSVWRQSQNILTLCCLYLIFVYKSTDPYLMQTQMLINMTQPNHSRNKCKLIASFCVSLVACILNVVSLRSALKPPPHPPYPDPLPSVLFPRPAPEASPPPPRPNCLELIAIEILEKTVRITFCGVRFPIKFSGITPIFCYWP